MRKVFLFGVAAVLAMASCGESDKSASQYIVIDMAEALGKKVPGDMTFNDIAEVVNVIPVATNDSVLMGYISVYADNDKYLIAHSSVLGRDNILFFINKNDGTVPLKIDRQGKGPEEYMGIDGVEIDDENKTVYVYDMSKQVINQYSYDGKCKSYINAGNLGSFRMLKDGNFAFTYNPRERTDKSIGIYDKDLNLIRESDIMRDNTERRMTYLSHVSKYNGELYYRRPLCDTIFHITTEYDEPFIVMNKGKYKMPDEFTIDIEVTDKESPKYIAQDYGMLAGKYFFGFYYYDDKRYYEIWDVETAKPIYRSVFEFLGMDGDKPILSGNYGIPVEIGGQEVIVWPSYVSGNDVYCKLENYDDAVKIVPGLKDDDNPVIVHLRIK